MRYAALLVGCIVFIIDFVSKYLTTLYIPKLNSAFFWYPYGGVGVFKDFHGVQFSIVHAVNKGAAWSLFADHHEFLFWGRIVLIFALIIYIAFFNKCVYKAYPLFLILAGAIGNIVDTFLYGHVVDMFRFIFWGYDYPVFNIADASICIGVFWLLLISFFEKGGKEGRKKISKKSRA